MKILIVIPSLRKGGAENVAASLSRELAKNHDVYLGLFEATKESIQYPYGGNLVDIACPATKSYLRKCANFFIRVGRLFTLLKEKEFDRIIALLTSANFPTLLAARIAGYSHCTIVSERVTPEAKPVMVQWAMSFFYRWAASTVLNAQAGCDYFVTKLKLPKNKVTTIPNPIDFALVKQKFQQHVEPLWKGAEPVVVACGRLVLQKGFDVLLKAFAEVLEQRPAKLVIFGEGPMRRELSEMIHRLGIDDHVLMPGITDNIYANFDHSDVFVLSSRFEGSPNVLLEAMAVGMPVVATNCKTGPTEILSDGRFGVLVPTENSHAIAQAILKVLDHPDVHKSLRESILNRASEFDVRHIAKRWLNPNLDTNLL